MHPTLAGYLAPLRPHLVPQHCSSDEFGEIIELAASLPSVLAGGFERRLGSGSAGLDLAICVSSDHPAADELRDGGYGGSAIRDLLLAVQDPSSSLHEALDTFWLEYDVSRGGRTPSLFASPCGDDPSRAVAHATELVCGAALEAKVVRELRRLALTVPGTRLFQVGWMLGRAKPGLRLCFVAHTLPSFHRLLDRLGDTQQRATLRECCDRYAPHVTEYMLAVDIGDGEVGERVGLELGFRGSKQDVPLERWGDLLLALERDGLCTGAQRMALLRWPGRMVETNDPERWPRHLRGAQALLGPYGVRIDRVLHHAKLVVERQDVVGAKVYFGVLQGWTFV